MEKKVHPLLARFQSIVAVVVIFKLFLFSVALISGRHLGYRFAFILCFCIGLMVALIFFSIILFNFAVIFVQFIIDRFINKENNRLRPMEQG